ncbi:MAG: M48 family metalloprotease [Chloroflexota bacterium]
MYRSSTKRISRPVRQNLTTRMLPRSTRPSGNSGCLRIGVALAMAAFAIISYMGSKTINPTTGEEQYITISKDQEIALGIQAAPEMANMYGGLDLNQDYQEFVEDVGQFLVASSVAGQSGYPFEFYLLADDQTVNAFALPGGQVFITDALFQQLETEEQLAGVLGHEIGHVIARHGAQRIAQQELSQGLTGAVIMATYDPDNPSSQRTAQVALLIGNLVTMKYGRTDELESDWLGVCILSEAGYDPAAMIEVMEILDRASAGARVPEFFSTHPDPGNRIAEIQNAIDNLANCP